MRYYLFAAIVVLPAVVIGISNIRVFPDSWLAATIMLVITVSVAGAFTAASGSATRKIALYCILADVIICAIMAVNLGGHWILAREVAAANQGMAERHAEEDRSDARKAAETERQLSLRKAEAEATANNIKLANAERRRLAELPRSERRSMLSAPAPQSPPLVNIRPLTILPVSPVAAASVSVKALTPDEVRDKWWWFLTGLAIAECAASVLAGAVLSGMWEWDRNRNGIADHKEGQVLHPPPGGPYAQDKYGNLVWAPGYGPEGYGHRQPGKAPRQS